MTEVREAQMGSAQLRQYAGAIKLVSDDDLERDIRKFAPQSVGRPLGDPVTVAEGVVRGVPGVKDAELHVAALWIRLARNPVTCIAAAWRLSRNARATGSSFCRAASISEAVKRAPSPARKTTSSP